MAADDRFDDVDSMDIMNNAVRSYWQERIDRGHETVPFDDLDPKLQQDVLDRLVVVAPHIIRALRNAMFNSQPVEVPDVIPDYFFRAE